ncbi:uncharacterized protein PHALS_14275 [Plasmopara halstedii]|uniref:Uncharacterized protein n=1 Tax=Plasmopara halstedii TaxID=4781 RepID=A0A0P1AR82_PLAHL|nr:uncharacterized protein PHALS_14275 [Plasmopara halstedii]CEG44002.1 hypothetical protein PHALS_14275 [Plasmopara halstedii]|eukprot:XP_024580371.1 hypothetical protein PHALS_14275 [Plasmopara halstedii]
MHMLFQSEAAYRRRRVWMPCETNANTTMLVTNCCDGSKILGPRRRGMSRNCSTRRREAKAAKHLAQRKVEKNKQMDKREHHQTEINMTLQDEVLSMTMEIETLQRRRLLLDSAKMIARTNAMTHAIDHVKMFYILFANGFNPVVYPEQSKHAATFLHGIMTEDVVCSDFRGVDLFLNQYKVATEAHFSMRLVVHDIFILREDESSHDSAIQVFAKANAHFRVSRTTLEKLFPCIINDEELTQQLIGKEYAIQYNKVFHFKDGRIFQHESQVDFCNSMLDMAQNPFVAMKLLEASLMTKHGHLKINNSIQEDINQLENAAL